MTRRLLAVHHSRVLRLLAVLAAGALGPAVLAAPAAAAPAVRGSDLSVSIAVPAYPVQPGQAFTTTVTITNLGPGRATGVRGSLHTGRASSATRDPSAGTCNGYVCAFPDLGVRQSVTVSVHVPPMTPGEVSFLTYVSSDSADPNGDNNSALETAMVLGPDLRAHATMPTDAVVGDDFDIRLTVTNVGPMTATDVALSLFLAKYDDELPRHVYRGATTEGPAGTCTAPEDNPGWATGQPSLYGNDVPLDWATCELEALAPGETVTMVARYTALLPTQSLGTRVLADAYAQPGDMHPSDNLDDGQYFTIGLV